MRRFGYFYCQLPVADLISLRQAVVRISAEPRAVATDASTQFWHPRGTLCLPLIVSSARYCSRFALGAVYLIVVT
jgi:hypothetical protein